MKRSHVQNKIKLWKLVFNLCMKKKLIVPITALFINKMLND